MSNAALAYLFFVVGSLCVLFGLNFLLRKGKLVVAKILGIQFLLFGYFVVAAYFLLPGNILETPYFFRTIPPLFYCLPPLNFLFIWHFLHPKAKFNPKFLVFFIPFVVQLIEYAPLYFSSKEIKIAEIKWMQSRRDYFAYSERFMWFNPVYHNYAKFFIYLIFYVAMVRCYLLFRRVKENQGFLKKATIHYWVVGFLIFRLLSLYYLSQTFLFNSSSRTSFIPVDLLTISEIIFHLVYLAINPTFLDIQILANQLTAEGETYVAGQNIVRTAKEEEYLLALADKIEHYFKTSEVFLNSQLTAELLGSLTGHPHRMIGKAIKFKHNVSFRNFLNNYRISYVEEKLSDPAYLANSSIEKIIEASGFGSRQSFYTAFKKAKSCTPKEYFSSRIG